MLCQFQVYGKVNLPYKYIYPLFYSWSLEERRRSEFLQSEWVERVVVSEMTRWIQSGQGTWKLGRVTHMTTGEREKSTLA